MATTTGYDYGVRQGLLSKGIGNDDIGYNPATGYVTIKGQNFMRPEKNYQGTTFTTKQNFENAWNQYQQSLPKQPQVMQPTQSAQTVMSYANRNPYDEQLRNVISLLTQQAQHPVSVDVNQIYQSPQYAAYQAQAQKSAQQGIRAAQEALGAAGFGRSTALAERAQGIQNDANEYLQTQVLPQLMASAQAERQQQFNNQLAAINALLQSVGQYDTRYNQDRSYNLTRDQLTGRLLSDQEREALPLLQQLVSLGEAWQAGTPDQRTQYSQQADAIRAQLAQMGIDPSLYDPNLSTEQRIAALNRLGTPTLAAQDQAFRQRLSETELMAALTGLMPDGTPTTAEQQRQLTNLWTVADQTGIIPDELADMYGIPRGTPTQAAKQMAEQLAISRMNASTSRYSAETARMNANLNRSRRDQQQAINEGMAQVIEGFSSFDNAADATAWLNANASRIISNLGADVYQELLRMIPQYYGSDTSGQAEADAQRLRQRAIDMAQKDFRWSIEPNKEGIIQEYIQLLGG